MEIIGIKPELIGRRAYESTFLIRPDLDRPAYDAILAKFNAIMADGGAKTTNQEVWGYKQMAYEIDGFGTAYYVYTEFEAPVTLIEKLEREYNYDERVIRYLTVQQDKHAVEYNARRRQRLSESPVSSKESAGE